jgi:hypothetical protein
MYYVYYVMVQFYTLSVIVNLLVGLLLTTNEKEGKTTLLGKIKELFEEKGAKFSLGILSLIVGLFKILTPTAGDVAVVGDLLPAITGLSLGVVLLLDFFKASSGMPAGAKNVSTKVEKTPAKTDKTTAKAGDTPVLTGNLVSYILANRKYIGIAGIVVSILHFLMPEVPII